MLTIGLASMPLLSGVVTELTNWRAAPDAEDEPDLQAILGRSY